MENPKELAKPVTYYFANDTKCTYCQDGRDKRGPSEGCMGESIPAYDRPCPHCGGTGRPGPEQARKAELERAGLCFMCGFPRHGPGWPHASECAAARTDEIHKLRAEVNVLRTEMNELRALVGLRASP